MRLGGYSSRYFCFRWLREWPQGRSPTRHPDALLRVFLHGLVAHSIGKLVFLFRDGRLGFGRREVLLVVVVTLC
jgi:hypothetical protein